MRQFNHYGFGIRKQEFRWTEPWPPLLFRRRPEADTAPRGLTACSSPSLVCTGQAAGDGLQPLHAGVGIKAQLAAASAVDHKAY